MRILMRRGHSLTCKRILVVCISSQPCDSKWGCNGYCMPWVSFMNMHNVNNWHIQDVKISRNHRTFCTLIMPMSTNRHVKNGLYGKYQTNNHEDHMGNDKVWMKTDPFWISTVQSLFPPTPPQRCAYKPTWTLCYFIHFQTFLLVPIGAFNVWRDMRFVMIFGG